MGNLPPGRKGSIPEERADGTVTLRYRTKYEGERKMQERDGRPKTEDGRPKMEDGASPNSISQNELPVVLNRAH
jgi:hypothetical protein